ncbi:RING finger protein [Fasciola hepatica]|uniref:RING finger protein n=1 Tax=Fasciola hepatica TaxID=6192 RepID=A0A4E0R9Q0_FASHE|nr:RING finger protein [Fasciola hepatica]
MHTINSFRLRSLVPFMSLVVFGACVPLHTNGSHFEITFYRLSNSSDRVTARYELSPHSPATVSRSSVVSIYAVFCLPKDHTKTDPTPDRRSLSNKPATSETENRVRITRVWCQNGTVPSDFLSHSNASLVIYIHKCKGDDSMVNSFHRAAVVAHRPNQTVLNLTVTAHDRLYQWMVSSQPVYARWSRVDKLSGPSNTILPQRALNTTSVNLLKQLSASQAHVDRNHVTTIMIYVLLAFFTLFVLTGILGLVGYLIQRLRHMHNKRRCSRHLELATRKAMKKLPLRTLRPSDIEVSSGYDQCAVCIELYKASDVIRILPCRHFYHKKCIDPWLLEQRSCPLCKLDILKSCGIMLGLSAEDESYLASRLVERDANSDSSTSSYSVSVGPHSVGSRIKRVLTSLIGKQTDSGCDACSLAYLHVMQLDALRYGIPPSSALRPILRNYEVDQSSERLPVFAGRSELYSPPAEFHYRPVERFFSWVCPCLCFWRQSCLYRGNSAAADDSCHPGVIPVCDTSVHATPFYMDDDTTQALHTARLLCYRNSQSTDRLCYYHASAMGVPNLFRTPHEVHWTRYASHYTTLRHHWNDARSRTVRFSQSVAHRSGWRQRFRSKRWNMMTSQAVDSGQKQSSLNATPREANSLLTPYDKSPSQSSPSEPLVMNVVDHHNTSGATNNASFITIISHHISSVTSNTNVTNGDTVGKLDECQRLSALPPISVVGTLSSSSSDGSSEPSLVILPPSSIPGYISPLDRLWSPWYTSAAHIPPPPPMYMESLSQSLYHGTTGVGPNKPISRARFQCKIRSRKFRGGYHPYLLAGIGRRSAQNHHFTFKEWLNPNTSQCTKSNPTRSWRTPFNSSIARQDGLVCSLSRLLCASRTRETSAACSDSVTTEPIKTQSTGLLTGAPPPYCQATEVVPENVSSNTTYFRPVHPIPWPNANISCPLCRAEMRQVAHLLREYHQVGPIWHRMIHPRDPLKRTVATAQWCTPCESTGRKPRNHHHHSHYQHHRHQGQLRYQQQQQLIEQKLSSTLRTAVHVHSYDLCQPPSYRPIDATVDSTQAGHGDSSESATTCRLQGVRVTVEPPEVQYHNGPLTSDSSSSPAASDPGEAVCCSDSPPDMNLGAD